MKFWSAPPDPHEVSAFKTTFKVSNAFHGHEIEQLE
jgi:hypothetical protein